jgi:hypothetical protein
MVTEFARISDEQIERLQNFYSVKYPFQSLNLKFPLHIQLGAQPV